MAAKVCTRTATAILVCIVRNRRRLHGIVKVVGRLLFHLFFVWISRTGMPRRTLLWRRVTGVPRRARLGRPRRTGSKPAVPSIGGMILRASCPIPAIGRAGGFLAPPSTPMGIRPPPHCDGFAKNVRLGPLDIFAIRSITSIIPLLVPVILLLVTLLQMAHASLLLKLGGQRCRQVANATLPGGAVFHQLLPHP